MAKIQLRRDSAANWTSSNPVLAAGELGFESNTGQFKIGDGSTAWVSLSYVGGAVSSVAGRTGVVTLTSADVGLGLVNNTSDAGKPVSTATSTALAGKEPTVTAGNASQYWRGDKSFQNLDKSAVGLSNVDNTADVSKPVSTATQTALNAKEATANRNVANGYAGLDATGLIPAGLLPSYVDDVLEYTNLAGFPATGETGKIYVDKATSKIYRWSGSVYVEISPSPGSTDSVTEGATNLYFTTVRAATAAPVQSVAGKTGTVSLVKADVGLGSVDNTSDVDKPVSTATSTALSGKEPTVTAGTASQYYRGDKSFQTLDKSAVGLSNVDNTSDAGKPVSTATATALAAKEATANKNAVNGYAGLDASGLVPASLLPSYVDDVLEYAALGNFPATGETGKIYVATGTGKVYRWSGSTYVEIAASPGSTDSVTEGSTNLYFTNARASAAAPVQSVAGKTGAVTLAKADVGLGSVDNTADSAKAVLSATKLATARAINGVSFDGTADIVVSKPRVGTTASSATPSIDCGLYDQYTITALAAAITGVTITGTPTDGQKLMVRIKDNGTAREISWGASFVSSGVATLLASTVASKTHMVGLIYDSVAAKFVCVAVDATGY
jgi:hypothetical protein